MGTNDGTTDHTEDGIMIRKWPSEHPKLNFLVTSEAYLSSEFGQNISDFFLCLHWVSVVCDWPHNVSGVKLARCPLTSNLLIYWEKPSWRSRLRSHNEVKAKMWSSFIFFELWKYDTFLFLEEFLTNFLWKHRCIIE